MLWELVGHGPTWVGRDGCGHMASRAGSSTAPKLQRSAGGSQPGLKGILEKHQSVVTADDVGARE